jgi:hypothetical protein
MIGKLYDFVDRCATWSVVAILVAVLVLTHQFYLGRQALIGPQLQLLGAQQAYSAADVQQFIFELGDQGVYFVASELTLGIIYPLVYGLLFAILLIRTWGPRYTWMVLAPGLAAFFDILGSILISYLIITFDGNISWLGDLWSFTWVVKIILFLLSLVLVLNGGIIRVFRVNSY